MPSLMEILQDPNYVNANEATKQAIFDKYSALDKDFVDANDATKDAIRQRFGVPITEAEPETSGIAALGHGILRSIVPSAAGLIGGAAGATVGTAAGPVGTIAGGLGAGFASSAAAAAAQEEFLKAHPEAAKFLGIDAETAAKEAKEHPYLSFTGELLPNVAAFRPSGALLRSGKGLAEDAARQLAAEKTAAAANAVLNAGVGAGMEAGQQAMGEEPMDYGRVGIAALGGALGQKETALGRGLVRAGEFVGTPAQRAAVAAFRRPEEIPPVEPAPQTQEALAPEAAPESLSQNHQAMLDEIPQTGEAIGKPIEEPIPEPISQPEAKIPEPIAQPEAKLPEPTEPTIVPADEPITKLTQKEEPAPTLVKVEPVPVNRLEEPDVRESLKRYSNEAGWSQKGGRLLRENADDNTSAVIGRTQWTPNASWWMERPVVLRGDGDGKATQRAINKALNGENLTPNEKKMVDFLVNMHDNDMVEGDRIRAEMEARDREVQEFNKQFQPTDEQIQAEMDRKAAEAKEAMPPKTGALDEDIPFDWSRGEVTATPEQIEQAQGVLKRIPGSDMAWQEGDLGLIRGYGSETGNVMYGAYKKGTGWTGDVTALEDSAFRRMGFTPEEQAKLVSTAQRLEKSAAEAHEKAPFLKLEKGLTFSPDVPDDLKGLIKDWSNMLGLKNDIYFTTVEHASANKDKFTGPHRKIGSASLMEYEGGFRAPLEEGKSVIAFSKSASLAKTLELISHEMGHEHMHQAFFSAPESVKSALQQEHIKWARSIRGNDLAKDVIKQLRARKTGKTTKVDDLLQAKNLKGIDNYWRSFSEWYADQTAKWATTNQKPLTLVEKFFSKLGKALKSFYSKLKNQGYLPTETFKNYMDDMVAKADLEPVESKRLVEKVEKPSEQMQLFSKGAAEQKATAKNVLGQEVKSRWEPAPVTKFSEFTRLFQNKHVDLRNTVDAIKKQLGEIEERFNPYLKEGLFSSKVANRSRLFVENEIDPLVKKMVKLKVSNEELHDYLHNRHAEEYNKQMNKINPDIVDENGQLVPYALKDRASGIHTDEARKYLASLDAKKKAALEDVAKDIDGIIKGTQKLLIESGQEKPDTINAWNNTYQYYVPLFREMESSNIPTLTKRGMGVSGGFSKRAMGSERAVADIANSVIGQREKAIEIAEKMEVDHALYGLSIKAPNPDIWLPVNPDAIKNPELLARELQTMGLDGKDIVGMMQEMKTRRIEPDPVTGLDRVVHKVNPLERYKDNVLPIRINGEDRYIFFNKDNPVSANMVKALRNMDVPTVGLVGKQIGKATQWMAKVNTQWNPVFGGLNFMRDFGSAMANLSSTELKGEQSKIAGGIKPAIAAIWKTMRAERAGTALPDTAEAKLYQEFREHGGQTLYREQLVRRSEQEKLINEKIKDLNSNAAKKYASKFFNGLSDFNDTIENAIRLSAYKAAKEKGMSAEKAATLAKELTVNFDRKGAYGTAVNNYFAFFNASAQGTARMAQTLKGPAGKKIIMGGIGLGALQAGMMAMAGFDENDPPEFVKSRNFIIPTVDGKYIAIPYPLGLHFLPNIGRIAVETGLHGDVVKHAGNMAAVVADAFNPLGGGDLSLQTISPTVLDPVVALATNRDAFGRPISKQDRATAPTPGFSRSREQATEANKAVAEAINYITGGTEDTKGFLSPTADQLDFLVGQVTGGAGREAMKIGKTAAAIAEGKTEELPSYQIPLAGRFYGDINSPAANSQHFYDNVTKMAEYENTIKGMRERKENVSDFIRENPSARLWQQANNAENQISQINKQIKDAEKRGLPEERIKALNDRKQVIMTNFNERVKALQE